MACVHCLFAVLSPRTGSEGLDRGMWIVEHTHRSGVRSVRLALLQGAQSFIERSIELTDGSHRSVEDQERHGKVRDEVEVFTVRLALALLQDNGPVIYEQETENLRRARVSLGLALVQGHVAQALPRDQLRAIFRLWLEKERSRPIREDIQRLIHVTQRV